MKQRLRRRGFTLVEFIILLTIIAILSCVVTVTLPRLPRTNPIVEMQGIFNDLRITLAEYHSVHNTYPPAYGYRRPQDGNVEQESPSDNKLYFLRPCLDHLEIMSAIDLFDPFSKSYQLVEPAVPDQLALLDYVPLGDHDRLANTWTFPAVRYHGGNRPEGEERYREMFALQRPLVYLPVNKAQFEQAKAYWINNHDWYASRWDADDPALEGISFPPENYDAYALVSVGPSKRSYGVIPHPPMGNFDHRDVYHVTILRAYFLSTRDLNENGMRDFCYEARKRRGEATVQYKVRVNSESIDPTPTYRPCANGGCFPNSLPDLNGDPNGDGVMVYDSQS